MNVSLEGFDVVLQQLDDLPPKVQRAAVRAMNRGVKSGRTLMARNIAQDTGLKIGTVRDAIVLEQATISDQQASLAASLKRVPLIDFGARGPEPSRGKGRGVTYRLTDGRGRIETAFITTLRSGHRGVFMRAASAARLPIRELFGPSLGRVFLKFREPAQARVIEIFQKNFGHELEVETAGFITAGPDEQGTPDETADAAA